MGCDIHLYVEAKNPETGKWESEPDAPRYRDRNYDVFAILANVRNGWGFAGVVTGNGFNIIAPPRGVPADISEQVGEANEEWRGDGHSHSFFSLKELLDYNWDQTTKHRGVVDALEYKHAKKNGKPESWCGAVTGPNIKHINNEEMDALIASGNSGEEHYTTVHWEEPYKESAGTFYADFLPALKAFAASSGLNEDDVRIVFWFDN